MREMKLRKVIFTWPAKEFDSLMSSVFLNTIAGHRSHIELTAEHYKSNCIYHNDFQTSLFNYQLVNVVIKPSIQLSDLLLIRTQKSLYLSVSQSHQRELQPTSTNHSGLKSVKGLTNCKLYPTGGNFVIFLFVCFFNTSCLFLLSLTWF